MELVTYERFSRPRTGSGQNRSAALPILIRATLDVDEVTLSAIIIINWEPAVVDNLHHFLDLVFVAIGKVMGESASTNELRIETDI